MNKIVWTEDSVNFTIRGSDGQLRCPKREELHNYATAKEVREALHRYEASLMPLPQYNVASGLYYWNDINYLWSEEDVLDDIATLWPGMDAKLLLLSSRQMAALGITD